MTAIEARLGPRLVAFVHALRAAGVRIPPDRHLLLAQSLALVDVTDRAAVHAAARATLVTRHEDLARFEEVFATFWRAAADAPAHPTPPPAPAPPASLQGDRRRVDAMKDAAPEEGVAAARFSAAELLRVKSFAAMDAAELAAVQRLILAQRWTPSVRATRRYRPTGTRGNIDARATLRTWARGGTGGGALVRRERRIAPRPLVLLCDVSGSMAAYARPVLLFAYALGHRARRGRAGRLEVFTFGTRLTRVTRHLQHADVDRALAATGHAADDWGGGTRMGAALDEFNRAWGRRVLGKGPWLVIVSDGFDRGDPALLATAMARLRQNCRRILWLNPHKADPAYEPLTRGMQAALPFIDDLRPVHNLASLDALAAAVGWRTRRD